MTKVTPDLLCVDRWPPESYTEREMQAYGALELTGLIQVEKVQIGRHTHQVTVVYRSAAPQDWTREALKGVRDGLEV